MMSKGIKFTLSLAVIALIVVSGYSVTCPLKCYCTIHNISDNIFGYKQRRHDVSCRFSTSAPFSGGITELFFNKTLANSVYTENLFAFQDLLMPVWRKSDSEVIAALANVNASSIVIELISAKTTIIANGSLEPLANYNVKILRLSDLPLTNLPKNSFAPLNKLETINVKSFASGTVKGNFFDFVPRLKYLEVSGSEKFVCKDILNGNHGLYSLQILDLRSNNLATIPEFAFSRMKNLRSVHLENNRLETIPEFILSPLTSLHSIHLENNQLTEFEIDLCPFLLNRTSTHLFVNIYLENNSICDFDYVIDSFSKCVLPSNNVAYLDIRAANNYYCNTTPVYMSLASGHSLTISILSTNAGVTGTCKNITSTAPPQCSSTESASVTSTESTTSSRLNFTTQSTSVTSTEATTSSTHSSTTKSTTITTTRGASITSSQSQSNIRAVSKQPNSDEYYYQHKPLGTGALVAIALGAIVLALGAVWIVRRYSGANIPQPEPDRQTITVITSHTPGLIDIDPRPRTGRPLPESVPPITQVPSREELSVQIRPRRVTVTIPLPDPPEGMYLHALPNQEGASAEGSEYADVASSDM